MYVERPVQYLANNSSYLLSIFIAKTLRLMSKKTKDMKEFQ